MWDYVREHLALVASATGVLLVALRLFAVAEFDTETALAILQNAGTADVVVGTMTTLLPLLVITSLLVISIVVIVADYGRAVTVAVWLSGIVPAVVAVFAPYGAGTGAVYIVWWLLAPPVRWLVRRGTWDENISVARLGVRLVVLVAVLLALAGWLDKSPWLPAETVRSPSGVLVGYVLDSGADGAVVLTEVDRRVVHVGPLTRRVLCRTTTGDGSLADALGFGGHARYPLCSESLV